MGDRFSPLGIPFRLAILLLPFVVGGLVTVRTVGWAGLLATEPAYIETLAAVEGPPVIEPVVEAVRERVIIAASREGARRLEPAEVEPAALVEVAPASAPAPDSTRIADLAPAQYHDLLLRTAERHGLDPRLLAAVIKLESRYDNTTVGTHGEVGLMQILAATGAWLASVAGMESYDLRDDETSLELGALYLSINLREYGTVEKALAVYNGGPRAAAGWATNIYVKRVMEFYHGG